MTAPVVAAKWLRRREAAATRAVSLMRLDELIASGEVDARRDGRRILVRASSLDAWIEGLPEA